MRISTSRRMLKPRPSANRNSRSDRRDSRFKGISYSRRRMRRDNRRLIHITRKNPSNLSMRRKRKVKELRRGWLL